MMTKWLVVFGIALAACASDDSGGGAGDGEDTLPKRGEVASDPTIVSATARCSCGSEICDGGSATSHVRVRVAASDPMGAANLGSCAGTLAGATDQDSYSEGRDCTLYFQPASACAAGQTHTIGITVSNDTGGVTTASVKLTVSP